MRCRFVRGPAKLGWLHLMGARPCRGESGGVEGGREEGGGGGRLYIGFLDVKGKAGVDRGGRVGAGCDGVRDGDGAKLREGIAAPKQGGRVLGKGGGEGGVDVGRAGEEKVLEVV